MIGPVARIVARYLIGAAALLAWFRWAIGKGEKP